MNFFKRSKSSANVPKTLNQSVKSTKPRSRPSSIISRTSSSSSYRQNDVPNKRSPASVIPKSKIEQKIDAKNKSLLSTSVDSDKESIENSKNSNFIPSDTSTAGSTRSTDQNKLLTDQEIPASFTLPVITPKEQQQPVLGSQRRMNDIMIQKNLAYNASFKSISSSSLIDHDDDLVFEDSLQEDSFDSDR